MESDNNKAGKKLKATLSFAAVAFMLLVAVSPLMIGDDVSADSEGEWIAPFIEKVDRKSTVPEGYIGVYTPEDLAKIGTGLDSIYDDPQSSGNKLKWSMDAEYIQMSNIDFTGKDLNNGFQLKVTSTPGSGVSFHIEHNRNGPFENAQNMNVWFNGEVKATDSNGDVSFTSRDNTKEYAVIIGGQISSEDVAAAFRLDSGNSNSTVQLESNGNFDPIGTSSNKFSGEYNGNGYVISGLETSGYTDTVHINVALFADLDKYSKIMNLGLVDGISVSVSDGTISCNSGGIVGSSTISTVTNCYNASSIYAAGKGTRTGGVAAVIGNTSLEGPFDLLTSCHNSGSVDIYSVDGSVYVSGVAGTITTRNEALNCYNTGPVTAIAVNTTEIYAGGIGGNTNAGVINSFNTAPIRAEANKIERMAVGGITGTASGVQFCYNSGEISGSFNILDTMASPHWAGVAGITGMGYIFGYNYNIGEVLLNDDGNSKSFIGAIAGKHGGYIWGINKSYFLENSLFKNNTLFPDVLSSDPETETDTEAVTAGRESGPRNLSELKDQDTYDWNLDVDKRWNIFSEINSGLPYLTAFSSMDIIIHPESCTVDCDSDAGFSVDARSAWSLNYKWQADSGNGWEDISSSGNSCSLLAVNENHHNMKFRCIVYNNFGMAISDEAVLSVNITSGPIGSGEHDDCWTCFVLQVTAIVLMILAVLVFTYSVVLWIRFKNSK